MENNEPFLTPEEEKLLNDTLEEVHREIPENSESALIKETTSRFSSAIWAEEIQKQHIVLAGVGGIGSWTALLLSRLDPSGIIIYDHDTVDASNISGQFYQMSNIEQSKVSAINVAMCNFSNYYKCTCMKKKFDTSGLFSNIMICGFDNMIARRVFFKTWLRNYEGDSKALFIDGRLSAENLQVFAIQGNDTRAIEDYRENQLFTDEEADPTVCSYKQTSFCANMIAGFITNIFVNFIANQCNPLIERDIPYLTEYNAETMYLKTIA